MRPAHWRIIVILAGLVSASSYAVLRQIFPPPKLSCDSTEFDLGTVKPGGKGEHTFHLRNVGGRALKITRMKSTCNCTKATLSKDLIRPGETATLIVVMTIPERATRSVGHIIIESNDPETPVREFALSVDPSPILAISPSGIDLGTIEYGRATGRVTEVTILCQDAGSLEFQVDDWSRSSPVHAEIVRATPRPRLKVWVDELAPIGALTATIRLATKSGDGKPLNLSVRGDVVGPMRAEPSKAYIDTSAEATSGRTRVQIIADKMSRQPQVKIQGISPELAPFVDANVVQQPNGTYLEINSVSGSNAKQTQPVRGFITLSCDELSGAQIAIPVFISGMGSA